MIIHEHDSVSHELSSDLHESPGKTVIR
jgi:hypothetical protein